MMFSLLWFENFQLLLKFNEFCNYPVKILVKSVAAPWSFVVLVNRWDFFSVILNICNTSILILHLSLISLLNLSPCESWLLSNRDSYADEIRLQRQKQVHAVAILQCGLPEFTLIVLECGIYINQWASTVHKKQTSSNM